MRSKHTAQKQSAREKKVIRVHDRAMQPAFGQIEGRISRQSGNARAGNDRGSSLSSLRTVLAACWPTTWGWASARQLSMTDLGQTALSPDPADPDEGIVVGNWTKQTGAQSAPYNWRIFSTDGSTYIEMNGNGSNDYGDLTSDTSLAGQGSGSNAPSEKTFAEHALFKFGNTYYEPSYGRTYADEDEMENDTLHGFHVQSGVTSGKAHVDVRDKGTGGLNMLTPCNYEVGNLILSSQPLVRSRYFRSELYHRSGWKDLLVQ